MKRRKRIFWIWFYGHLPLAKKIKRRITIEVLCEHLKGREHASAINPLMFQDAMNRAQSAYVQSLAHQQDRAQS